MNLALPPEGRNAARKLSARKLSAVARVESFSAREAAHDLAARLPRLMARAREAASSYLHGAHGRRRAGPGDAFWQFRQYAPGESAARIDWRRSARDDRLYVREREWEAAHAIWSWIDMSPSMAFVSDLARAPKIDRAIVLGLALSDALARAGERVGLMGLTPSISSRDVIDRFAQALAREARIQQAPQELPPAMTLPPRARALLIGDGLADPAQWGDRVAAIAARGAKGYFLLIADPIEESFPFEGHVELQDLDSPMILRIGRAQDRRADYIEKLAVHRQRLAQICRVHGFGFAVHRTDRPASEALLKAAAWHETGGAR